MKTFKLSFNKSKSKNYIKVLKLCNQFENFKENNTENIENTLVINIEELVLKFNLLSTILTLVKDWKNVNFYKNDEIIDITQFKYYYNLINECNNDYYRINKTNHCNDSFDRKGWGCKHINKILRDINYASKYRVSEYWYRYGWYENDLWHIDKKAIIKELNNEINSKNINLCNIFNYDNLLNEVDNLPDTISLNENWEFEYIEDFEFDKIVNKVSNIKHISKAYNPTIFGVSIAFEDSPDEAEHTEQKNDKVYFDDIGGNNEVINKIKEIFGLPLSNPNLLKKLGISPYKGIILYGEPGNGKTLLAKATSNEFDAYFISIKGSELISKYHGESESRLTEIFNQAKENAPSIIYFDEFDSIASRRTDSESSALDNRFVNQLLTLIDGIDDYDNVFVMASTNRIELIDEALLRAGRFDFKIEVSKPDLYGIIQIIEIHKRKMLLEDFDSNFIADYLLGYSGSEITLIFKNSAMECLKRNFNMNELINNKNQEFDLNKISISIDDIFKAITNFRNQI